MMFQSGADAGLGDQLGIGLWVGAGVVLGRHAEVLPHLGALGELGAGLRKFYLRARGPVHAGERDRELSQYQNLTERS